MLVIRMQRTGRKGHAMFRVVVQDSRRTPSSGKVVAALGSYDPHSKTVQIDKEKAQFYLDHGAQPSDRAALLLKAEGIKLPKWVKAADKKEGTVRNPDKRRSTRPPEPEAPAEEAPAEEAAVENSDETPVEVPAETETPEAAVEEAPAEEPAAEEAAAEPEAPAEEVAPETEENPAE
ncbi:MAG TPA: 30S ribosomal protein S16 [Candidatus Saccharimonadales bacterium]|nr:30S ribosomal protein S16 [Candidatus Saccharimonadales bacterium]